MKQCNEPVVPIRGHANLVIEVGDDDSEVCEVSGSPLDHPLAMSGDALFDVLVWLQEGNYVVLHDGMAFGRSFHRDAQDNYSVDECQRLLRHTRVIYVNLGPRMPRVLDVGEWYFRIVARNIEVPDCVMLTVLNHAGNARHCHTLRLMEGTPPHADQ